MGTIYEDHNRAERAYGSGDVSKISGASGSPLITPPWNSASGYKGRPLYDKARVREALVSRQGTEKVDPRYLRATQPHLVRAALNHYLTGHEDLYADEHNAGNKTPVVYARNNRDGNPDMPNWWTDEDHIILSGHHRAAAALLRGEQFNAIVVRGPHGE